MKPFIRAIEIWVPSADHMHLELGDSIYSELPEFKASSEAICFAYDEGLPGKAWASGHPIVLPKLEDTFFLRAAEARQAGLTSAVAMPVFSGEFLRAVMVFLCGDGAEHHGAIEVWHCDTREGYDLKLMNGYFGSMDHFRFLSEKTSFRKGTGLPGLVWERDMPIILSDLGKTHGFIRSEGAEQAGVTSGLGIPCTHDPEQIYVMDFLSARGTPIARRMEIWQPDEKRENLCIHSAYCGRGIPIVDNYAQHCLQKGEGAIGRAWLTGIPSALDGLKEDTSIPVTNAFQSGFKSLLAIPIIRDGWLKSVVTMYT